MLRDWFKLIRVPAVFTAMADVVMGFFFVTPVADFGGSAAVTLVLLVAASSLLYSAGMVLNDVCDYEEDCRDRPERPLPSGRISRRAAAWFGTGLLVGGVLTAAMVSMIIASSAPWEMAFYLCSAIVLYNLILKRTWAGPVALGICRAINVLLGMSVLSQHWEFYHFYVAGAVELFVIGVSVMARSETRRGARGMVLLGIVLMMAAVGSLAWLPDWRSILVRASAWRSIVALLAVLVGWRCWRAVVDPSPAAVQQAVGQSLRSLVVLDAVITAAVAGLVPGVAVLALLVPNVVLSRWFYST